MFILPHFLLFFTLHADITIFFGYHKPITLLAVFACRLVPGREFTFWELVAAIKNFATFTRPPLNQLAIFTGWTFYTCKFYNALNIFAFWIA